jgi:phosphoribosylformimino-5-aminoimidazole carboxamide ribotide isomerase
VNLYPAIDILGGSAVRLRRGDFADSTVYDADPLAAARGWARGGARFLHVVDLDGAKQGAPVNLGHLERITGETGIPVQYGGGLRTAEAVEQALAAGASRVVLGTVAFTDPPLLTELLARHSAERIVVAIDVRGGRVATHGWLQSTDAAPADAVEALRETGARTFVFTSIDHDGMLDGPGASEVAAVAAAAWDGSVIVSGGVGELEHLRGLAALREERGLAALEGVIVGKALYEGRFTVEEALAALDG